MIRKSIFRERKFFRWCGGIALAVLAATWIAPVQAEEETFGRKERLPYELQEALEVPMREAIRNAAKDDDKRASYSKSFRKVDDSTYIGSYHLNTAGKEEQTTQRISVTLKKDGSGWKASEETIEDTYVGMFRPIGGKCYPFESLNLEKYGMTISSGSGAVCELYNQENVYQIHLGARDLRYEYAAPDYSYFQDLYPLLLKKRSSELIFDPRNVVINCSPEQCEDLLSDNYFRGLDRVAPDQRPEGIEIDSVSSAPQSLINEVKKFVKDRAETRKDNNFSEFSPPYEQERDLFDITIFKNDDHWVGLSYDSLGGYEVEYYVWQNSTDPFAIRGTIFGYYTPETIATSTPQELEERDDYQSRFYELWKVNGEVEAALDDPEMFKGNIDYGLTVKKTTRILPFFVASIRTDSGEEDKKATMFINSIQLDGEEMTWVQFSPFSGAIVFPEAVEAGTRLDLNMDFSTRAIRKVNHAFSQMYRGGWLPFVRFGDFIDEFELTISTPAQYKTLGVGRKVWEQKKGDVITTHWVADSPVAFPTIIFGRYEESSSKVVAKHPDGTVIPVTVHVDTVSTIQTQNRQNDNNATSAARGIRVKQLTPIADQAANSINLYEQISGVPYPYGELNLVNDPAPALYGQAPSSLIYLGSLVFRGEGTMASRSQDGTRTAKFLKSVTAHEVGHQWWGSVIANKNPRNYWFVETMAEFFSGIYLEDRFSTKEYLEQVDEWKRKITETDQWVSVQNADTLWQGAGDSRTAAIYNKGPYAFHILRMTFGDQKFFPALKQFTQELAEKGEVVTRDIQVAAERAFAVTNADGSQTPVDLEWFFDQWIRSPYIPQYKFDYETRPNEAGGWIVEGTITQRLVVGNQESFEVAEGKTNRGVAALTVRLKGGKEIETRLLVENEVTSFRFAVPEKPLEVVLNSKGELLSFDPVVNQRSW